MCKNWHACSQVSVCVGVPEKRRGAETGGTVGQHQLAVMDAKRHDFGDKQIL